MIYLALLFTFGLLNNNLLWSMDFNRLAHNTNNNIEDDWLTLSLRQPQPRTISLPPELAVTSLFFAIHTKNGKDIVELIDKHHIPVNQTDSKGRTPLHFAAAVNHKLILETLLSKGASKKCADQNGNTAFHHAVISNAEESINVLCNYQSLEEKISPNLLNINALLNGDFLSPLELAIQLYKKGGAASEDASKLKTIIQTLALSFARFLDTTQEHKKPFFYNSYDSTYQHKTNELIHVSRSCPEQDLLNSIAHTQKMLGYIEYDDYDNIVNFCQQHRKKQ